MINLNNVGTFTICMSEWVGGCLPIYRDGMQGTSCGVIVSSRVDYVERGGNRMQESFTLHDHHVAFLALFRP